jgi:L-cysteine:1D-myo-inositol 2-amino-2-deoxy-alpha-D-glucopyranoside ligase
MGHAATYVAFDSLIRLWRASGTTVNYTQNITDVDDPLIERAVATGKDWRAIATEQVDLFRDDMSALRVIPPQNYIGVVESMELIESAVSQLLDQGVAYRVAQDIYCDMAETGMLGTISHLSNDQMMEIIAQRGGDPERAGKRHAFDPMLWRGRVGADPFWPSALGEGRPGWHIECSAIATKYLGAQIDVQGGGSDLMFPHHEMSAAHAESLTGQKPFAKTYMHAGMVALDGQKMSKSLGNLVFVSKLRKAGTDPMAIRLAILAHHYRSDWEWFDQELVAAESRLAMWRSACTQDQGAPNKVADLVSALVDDLDTPKALEIVDQWAIATTAGAKSEPTQQMQQAIDALLGII